MEIVSEKLLEIFWEGAVVAYIDPSGEFVCLNKEEMIKALHATGDDYRKLEEAADRISRP